MSELTIQLRKDLKLLSSDATFAIFITVLVAISLIIAMLDAAMYVNSMIYGQSIMTEHSIITQQKSVLASFWTSLIGIESAIMMAAAAMSMTVEKDSGMLRYTLSTTARKMPFFLSKFIVVTLLAVIAVVIALLSYVIAFAVMDVQTIPADILLSSLVFPLLTLISFTTLGLLLASLIRKKGMAVVVAIVAFFILSLIASLSIGLGSNAAYQANNNVTPFTIGDYMPLHYKVLILMDPTTLVNGVYLTVGLSQSDIASSLYGIPLMYDALGGVLLGVAMIAVLFVLGYLVFARERPVDTLVETDLPGAGVKEA